MRLRQSGPDGVERGELVLRNGAVIGAAIYRIGGVTGSGDALVEAGLCSPEDAASAFAIAAARVDSEPGALAAGAARVGVSLSMAVEALTSHIHSVVRVLSRWRTGTWEFALDGLPAGIADRDSAAARAFLLDDGLPVAEVLSRASAPTGSFPAATASAAPGMDATDPVDWSAPDAPPPEVPSGWTAPPLDAVSANAVKLAAEFAEPTEPDRLIADLPLVGALDALPPPPAVVATSLVTSVSIEATPFPTPVAKAEATPAEGTPVEGTPVDTPAVTLDSAWGDEPSRPPEPLRVPDEPTGTGTAVVQPPPPVYDEPATPPAAGDEPTVAPPWDEPTSPPPDAGSFGDEPTPSGEFDSDRAFDAAERRETASVSAEQEPAPAKAEALTLVPPLAAAPEEDAPSSDEGDDASDEPDEPDEPDGTSAGVDLSAPGFGESALMEAETLLDSEVLSVMLEMGSSAASIAAETLPEAGDARTGHLVLVDEDGILAAVLIAPLRDAGYVVHAVRGRAAAIDALSRAASEGERPLVVSDLLLTREAGGMLGGLDVAAHARGLEPPPPVVLLAETTSDEVRAMAAEANVAAILPRPLKTVLRTDEAVRRELSDALLIVIDEHRPRAEWHVPQSWEPSEAGGDDGWDVDGLARKAEEVEDLPELGIADPAIRRDALWRETMRELAGPLSPPEILLQILRFGAEVLGRGVLFTPLRTELRGFGQFGVELAPDVDPDESVRQIHFVGEEHPEIVRAVNERTPLRFVPGDSVSEVYIERALGGRKPREAFLGPVFCQGRLAALLYGDMLPANESVPDTTHLEVILGQAGLALDRFRLETRLKDLESGKGGSS